ncbi:MAG: chromosome segregation protein SMC [Bacteroidota bacterium]
MRLQRLEIKGFKSFANQTVIHFNEDVVGVVGPNGSGKSNIVDSIRWVLGEQKSKELRLDQMSSVIFNGTKNKKQSGLAQVTLTFENTKNLLPTEYNTVSIARLLYRTGESEYRLNNVPCRLKDITSLFLDTGIGSNSYAIIALGMVDDILADKDNARRKMFEQAAGISKYKIRKRETLNKLKNTSADLERVEDLLHEISGQLGTLEKQAKRTRRYFELKEQYKTLSIELALIKMQQLKNQHHSLKAQLEKGNDQYRSLAIELRQVEAKLEAEKKANLDGEKALSERQRDLNSFVGRIRGMENDKKIAQQKINFLAQNQGQLEKQIALAKDRLSQLEAEILQYRTDLNAEKRVEAELETQLDAAEGEKKRIQAQHGNLRDNREVVLRQQQKAEQAIFELEKQQAINANQIKSLTQTITRHQMEIEQRSGQIGQLQLELNDIASEQDDQQTHLQQLELAKRERSQKIEALAAKLEALRNEQSRINRKLDAKRNEFQLTKSMIDNFEGFPASIRFLSNPKNWKSNAPLLSDLIYVQEEYRVPIENYLESVLNYYVVQTEADALAAIKLLSNAQQGKANFFILDAFRNYAPPIQSQTNAKPAIELVEVEALYYNLCSYLLEKVVLVDKDEAVNDLSTSDFIVLTKSGRLTRRKYVLSGGSVGLFEGKKIGRKKNLEILATDIKALERQADRQASEQYSLKDQLTALQKEQAQETSIKTINHKINQLLQKRAAVDSRLENFQSFLQGVESQIQEAEKQIEALKAQNKTLDEQLGERQEAIQSVKSEIAKADGSFQSIAEALSKASTAFNEQNIQYIRQQNRVNSLQQELNFREKQLQDNESNLQQSQRQQKQAVEELDLLKEEVIGFEEKLLTAYEEKKKRAGALTEFEQSYFKARERINVLEKELRLKNKTQQDTQIHINQLKEKFSDAKYKISSLAQRLRIEFEIDINELINQQKPTTNAKAEELQPKVDRLKSRLDNYGEINPMAVEAFDAIQERHDTITQQRDDILKAKDHLLETIKEIEHTATAQFLSAFEQTRVYFIEAFRSLFTEDDVCDLILLDPENPLDSKIEIVAKPKGKRPQTISQLSGGEKTLTATALLFALYLLKPAPFCIFDEVDAPLDDANIEKFNNIIRKFSKDSQFIIVTHNKLTMAAVDTIYGVHNQGGISSVLPVDFRALKHENYWEQVQEA